ncbi:hypothetical protein KJ586_03065 [Patescibacteria group bacterium]|nr:hypothetical protein [Patescibacteria group bacterium]MBU4455464.1 hypothetical protein [Patescibacteria group bacterium]
MIAELNIIKNPVYGTHYRKGDVGFIHRTGEGADWICKLIALLGSDPFALVRPNHTILITGENTALETAGLHGSGTQEVEIKKNFIASKDLIFFRRPKELTENMDEIIKKGRALIGTKFDMWPIWWAGLEKLLLLENRLKYKPVPRLRGRSNLMCSNYFALIFQEQYQKYSPFKDRHWTKVSPWHLWTGDWLEPFAY